MSSDLGTRTRLVPNRMVVAISLSDARLSKEANYLLSAALRLVLEEEMADLFE